MNTTLLSRRLLSPVFLLLAAVPFLHAELKTPVATAAPLTRDQLNFFESKIRPVLVSKCYSCHSSEAKKVKGGLLLDTREAARMGGDTGHAVVPGSLSESLLIEAIRWQNKDRQMPPKEKLPDEVIADFEKWVMMGAPDPRDAASQAVKRNTSVAEGKSFWAFQPPRAVAPPSVKNSAWPANDIDHFILAAQETKGLTPAPDASKATLLRRIYFDLIGLPPTPEAVKAFLESKDPKAYEKVVDQLLASPQYGERWGRHWLDVARYAESSGKDRNYTFPQAWHYRDYVIQSVNEDKPYDRFIREQVAGDLLPARDANDRNNLIIATGFLAIGPKSLNEKNREIFRMDVVDDQIDVTSRAVLGLTASCARCHDHKFDPIPTRDYYALAGIFRSTETFYGTQTGKSRDPSSLLPLAASDTPVSSLVRSSAVSAAKEEQLESDNNKKKNNKVAKKKKQQDTPAPAAAAVPSYTTVGSAMGVLDGRPADSPIFLRGEVDSRGNIVPRGFLSILDTGHVPPVNPVQSGRLELAQWLTSTNNPLTARVMANRVWQHLFGVGLVHTADNFGAMGERPTHPELLDHLALHFMADGWSVKQLIRYIVLSRTYRMGSDYSTASWQIDPDNVLFWRANQRRLDAEAIRDAMLEASGQLELYPPRGSLVQNLGDGLIGKAIRPEVFNLEARYRSVYLPIVRDFVPDFLGAFDFAEPNLVVANRDVTNVPTQALFLLNNTFVYTQSEKAAQQLLARPNLSVADRVNSAYLQMLGRPPTTAERDRALRFLKEQGAGAQEKLAWTTFCQALFACAEFRYVN